jgi:DNA-directed RNA polymerase subunit RPC12/RpoP
MRDLNREEMIRAQHFMKYGRKFPIKATMLTYKCGRCGSEWERISHSPIDQSRCPLAKCQGGLITKIIRILKKENSVSRGDVIRDYDIEMG